MRPLIDAHNTVFGPILARFDPTTGWHSRPVWVSHGDSGLGPRYQAMLLHPPHLHPEEAMDGIGERPEGAETPVPDHPEGRWITARLDDPDGPETRLFVHPGRRGHVIAAGAGGKLNGLLLSGILDNEDYRQLGMRRRYNARRQQRLQELVARLQQAQVEQEAAAAGQPLPQAPQEHRLPMTLPQANAYAQAINAANILAARQEHGQGPSVPALKRLAPEAFLTGRPEELVAQELAGNLSGLRQAALDRVVDQHPAGAKAVWVRDFAGRHRGEPVHIVSASPERLAFLREALTQDGHRVALLVPPFDETNPAHQEAVGGFIPRDGDRHVDVFIGPQLPMMLPHHVVYYDTPMVEPVDPARHLSAHVLTTDSPYERDRSASVLAARQRAMVEGSRG
jgi:hypothetical protein